MASVIKKNKKNYDSGSTSSGSNYNTSYSGGTKPDSPNKGIVKVPGNSTSSTIAKGIGLEHMPDVDGVLDGTSNLYSALGGNTVSTSSQYSPTAGTQNQKQTVDPETGQPLFATSNRTDAYYDRVSALENDYPDDFSLSGDTANYLKKLHEVEAQRPADFESKYTQNIENLLNTIQNPEKFDLKTNDTYKQLYDQYRESYMAQGDRAARDAAGAAAALSGGYGSSYSANAASQAYDNYLQALNDQNVNLYNMALSDYWNNRNDYYNQLNAVNNQDQTDYGRYRDKVGDWQTDRAYYAKQYQDFYGNDYQAYRDDVGDYFTNRGYYADMANNAWNQDFSNYSTILGQFNNNREFQNALDMQEYQKQQDAYAQQYQQAQDYLSGVDSKALIDALNNGDTATAEQLRQKAVAYQQALAMAGSGGSGGSGGGGGRRSSGNSKTDSKNMFGTKPGDSKWMDFAEQIGLALNSGAMSNDQAAKQVESAVNAGNYSYEAGEKILDYAGIDFDAYQNTKKK